MYQLAGPAARFVAGGPACADGDSLRPARGPEQPFGRVSRHFKFAFRLVSGGVVPRRLASAPPMRRPHAGKAKAGQRTVG